MLKPFDIEFQPFIDEINAKERVIQECGDFATMERVKGMILHMVLVQLANLTQASDISGIAPQIQKVAENMWQNIDGIFKPPVTIYTEADLYS